MWLYIITLVYDKQSMPSQNDEEIVSDLGSNKKKLSLMECPFKELSQRTSMKNINSQMTNGMCCEADRPSQEKQEPAKEKDKELKPSDFIFFASNSTFHGINHIFTSAPFSFRKLLWAMAVLSSLALCINQAYDRYIYYRSRPHVTKLDEQEALEMNFPAVTICNMNPFRLNAITTDDYYYAGREILRLFTNNYDTPTKFRDNRTWPIIEEKIKPIRQQRDDYKPKSDTFNMFEFYNRTGHTIKGMLKGCKYRGEGCLDKYWTQVYTRYGKCYTFNSGKDHALLKTLKGGIGNGLEILLDTEQDEYMPVWAETDEISIEAGFKVQIHAHTEPPFIHELGFSISPGFQTLVATQEQRITFLPKPYGNCISGVNKSRHYHYKNYSISACRITCETEFVVHECGCRMIHMPGNASFCSPETYKRCADKTLNFLEQEDETYCVCGTPCDVTRYNLESSTLQLPSTQALSYMAYKYKRSEEYLRNNFAKLNIFFEALNYETIEQKKAYEIPGLFGDIGGQMGLFIGASILTILELFDYLYEVIKWKIFGKPTGKSKHSLSSKSPKESSTEMEVLHYPQQQQHGIHDDMNNRTSYTNYSHIFSSPEFDCASKPFLETQTNFDESNSQLQHPVSQYFGNSLISPKENTMSENVCLPLTSPPRRMPLVYPSQMSPQQMQDTSLSYGDLYKKPENNWPGSNYQHQTSPPGWPYTDTMGTSNMGYSAASTTPVTSQSSVRQRIGESSMPNGAPQQQGIAPSSCPTYNMAIDLQDYPISIETDIN